MSNNGKPTALQTDRELATTAFESFLTPEEDKVEEAVTTEVVEEVIEEDELPEAAELEEDVAEDEEAEVDEEELDSHEEQVEVSEEEQPTLHTVKVDGQELEVTLDELVNGYSRQRDYTRKTQELSTLRKEVEQRQIELAEKDAIYGDLLPQMEQMLTKGFEQEPDWEGLREVDPIAYLTERDKWNERQKTIQSVKKQKEELQQKQFQEQQEKLAEVVQEGRKKLLESIPEWKDDTIKAAEERAIVDYGVNKLGFSPEEMGQVYDYRILLMARNAWLYDQANEAVKKKPVQKAKSRVARPGAANVPKTTSAIKKAKQRLAKSGKASDAASVFEQII